MTIVELRAWKAVLLNSGLDPAQQSQRSIIAQLRSKCSSIKDPIVKTHQAKPSLAQPASQLSPSAQLSKILAEADPKLAIAPPICSTQA